MNRWLNLPRRHRALNAALITAWLVVVATLSHGFLLGVVSVLCMISLLLIVHPEVDYINVHLDPDGRIGLNKLGFPCEFVIEILREKGRQRINADSFFRLFNTVRGDKFPCTLHFGGNKESIGGGK